MRYPLHMLLIALALGPPLLAAVYLAPSLTIAFLLIVGSSAFAMVRRSHESWKVATAPLRKRLEELEDEIEKLHQAK